MKRRALLLKNSTKDFQAVGHSRAFRVTLQWSHTRVGTKCRWGPREASSHGSRLTAAPLPWRTWEEPRPGSHVWGPSPT